MCRRFRLPGPRGGQGFTYPQPDIFCRSVADCDLGLSSPQLLRVAGPTDLQIDIYPTKTELGPPFVMLPPAEAIKVCQIINEAREKKGEPPIEEGTTHFAFQVTFGPQITYHQPINRLPFHHTADVTDDRNSAEIDNTIQATLNLAFHKENQTGIELSVTAQGSWNIFVLDPGRSNPEVTNPKDEKRSLTAWQAQLQLQFAWVFLSKKDAFNLSFIAQIAGALTYQYNPVEKRVIASYTKQGAFGISLEVPITDKFSIISQITAGGTGPASNVTGFQTLELFNGFVGGQVKF
jgi:hypothetical protein